MRTHASGVVYVSLQLSCGMHHRFATMGEAERLVERGECRRIRVAGRKHIGKVRPIYRLIKQAEPSDSESTTAAITVFDLRASMGMVGNWHEQRAAKAKIRNYQQAH